MISEQSQALKPAYYITPYKMPGIVQLAETNSRLLTAGKSERGRGRGERWRKTAKGRGFLFIYLKSRSKERERNSKICHPLAHSHTAAVARPAPGACSSIQTSHLVAGGLCYIVSKQEWSLLYASRCIIRELNQKWNHWDLNRHASCCCYRRLNTLSHRTGPGIQRPSALMEMF